LPADGTFWLQISEDPLVYCITSGWNLQLGLRLCLREAGGRPFYVLVSMSWHVPSIIPELLAFHFQVKAQKQNVRAVLMCPLESDAVLLRDFGVDALHVHHNAFIDETIFKPVPETKKEFSAIHVANLAPWKRHELAWGVRGIAVVTYDVNRSGKTDALSGYEDIAWTNRDAEGRIHQVSGIEVADLIRRSNCGLILSELEGGNFASSEYLFCGVPVISTLSRGGRHEFFDPRCVTIVPPERAAVESAVEAMTEMPVDRSEIHSITLRKAIAHRLRLLDWLSQISGRDIRSEANSNAWLPTFRDKLRMWVPLSDESGESAI